MKLVVLFYRVCVCGGGGGGVHEQLRKSGKIGCRKGRGEAMTEQCRLRASTN